MTVSESDPVGAPSIFLSYARDDAVVVRAVADALERLGIKALLDVDFLQPGQRWETVILSHVRDADALAFFVSPTSLQSRWVEAELVAFAQASSRPIFPILINGTTPQHLPSFLGAYQAVVLGDSSEADEVAASIAEVLQPSNRRQLPLPDDAEYRAARLASDLAEDLRHPDTTGSGTPAPNAVFLVHGHDHALRDEVDQHVRSLGIEPVVLSKVGGASRSLFQKFESLAQEAKFAVVLLSPDDLGASRRQFEAGERGGEKTLKYRARENVILELGFFYGRLGWERVFVVYKAAEHVWPDFELPSDLGGVTFFDVSGESDWRAELAASLAEAGLVTASAQATTGE